MNYFSIIIIGSVCLILGWLLGYYYANKKLSNLEEAIKFVEEAKEGITVEYVQYLNAASEIELLKKIENGETNLAAQHVIDNLGLYYKMSSETVEDQMASEDAIKIVETIENLAKESTLFKKVVEYQE
ncbi:MAG: hypothetical protein OEV42_05965 [Deltaproteobacteria bacterium]|nr:hypothetical protein [Deltaproteobacteria bacterium]